jgi:hypothetical protein
MAKMFVYIPRMFTLEEFKRLVGEILKDKNSFRILLL